MRFSFDYEPTSSSFKNLSLDGEESFYKDMPHHCSSDLKRKLELMYQRIRTLSQEIDHLKAENRQITKRNHKQ